MIRVTMVGSARMLAPSERADLIVDFADHLHGAKAPAESDGYPENWYVPGKSALYHYPNHRDAAMLWYHAGEKKG